MNRSFKLIALDVDGTLLKSDKSVHPDTPRDICRVSEAGIEVVYCTGRGVAEMHPIFGFFPTIRYAVCCSGAVVYDRKSNQTIHNEGIDRFLATKIADEANARSAMLHILTQDESIVSTSDLMRMDIFHMGIYQPTYLKLVRQVEDMSIECRRQETIAKMNVYFRSPEDRNEAYETLRHLPLSFAFAEETSLEMTAKNVNKASGLLVLLEYLGIDPKQTLGFGDAENDLEMLDLVGVSVAMGNAEEEIQQKCDIITTDNDHNGVGRAIYKICSI